MNQPSGTEPVNATFAGDSYDTPSSATSTLTVTEPTTLTVNATSGSYNSPTTISGVLTDSNTGLPVAAAGRLHGGSSRRRAPGMTDDTSTASCKHHAVGVARRRLHAVTGNFTGDADANPCPLIRSSTNTGTLTVTPAPTPP